MPGRNLRVLSHSLRVRLLFEYAREERSPSELARQLSEPLNLVAYHTGILVRDGCIELTRSERRRGALTRFYRTTVPVAIEDVDWESLPIVTRRALVLGTLEPVHAQAKLAAFAGGFDGPQVQLTRSPLLLDDEGVTAVARALRTAATELEAILPGSTAPDSIARTAYEIAMLAYERPPGAD